MRKVISFLNIKGGVGKTASCVNIGAVLAQKGYSVLIVDIDKQSNSTQYLNQYVPDSVSMFEVMTEGISIDEVITPTEYDRLFIARSNIKMILATDYKAEQTIESENVLAEQLVNQDYDYILIDCPPNLNYLVTNALVASTDVLVPIKIDKFALDGFSYLVNHINEVNDNYNATLNFSGVFVTMDKKRTNISKQVKEMLKENLGDLVFENTVRDNAALVYSTFAQKPVINFDKRANSTVDYTALTEEIIKKL